MNFKNHFTMNESENLKNIIYGIDYCGKKLIELQSEEKPYYGVLRPFNYADFLSNKTLNYDYENENQVYDYIMNLFNGMPNWKSPKTLLNIIPPASDVSVVSSMMVDRANANISHDEYAGYIATAELEVIKYISDLVGWNWKNSTGIFTFGGKGTIVYALRSALVRAEPDGKINGYNKDYFFITSVKAHPCYAEVASWLGIGSNACKKVKCDDEGKLNIDEAYNIIKENIKSGKTFLGFIAVGGTTVELEIDNIKSICELRKAIVDDFDLSYTPWIHTDSVVGWVWSMFNSYDFDNNPLSIPKNVISDIKDINNDIKQLTYADSFGVDFHKTGFCPYISSLFMVKNREDFFKLGDNTSTMRLESTNYGEYAPFEQTLELTRSAKGPIGALSSLKLFGIKGYQEMLIQLHTTTSRFRDTFSKKKYIRILNSASRGIATLFFVTPTKYENMSLDDILLLNEKDIEYIKNYNMQLADFICKANETDNSLLISATDAFPINGTRIYIGMMKAYSLSLVANNNDIIDIIDTFEKNKIKFDNSNITIENISNKPSDMVYRKG